MITVLLPIAQIVKTCQDKYYLFTLSTLWDSCDEIIPGFTAVENSRGHSDMQAYMSIWGYEQINDGCYDKEQAIYQLIISIVVEYPSHIIEQNMTQMMASRGTESRLEVKQ